MKIDILQEEAEELLRAKLEYGQLFLFDLDRCRIIARPLTIAELESVMGLMDILEETHLNTWATNLCVLYCSNGNDYLETDAPAGWVESIGQAILIKSSIKNKKEFDSALKFQRNRVNTLQYLIEGFITQAYKNLSPKEIRALSQQRQLEYLARAEMLLGTPFEVGKKKRRVPGPLPGFDSVGGDLGSEAERITSRESADIPNFAKDNRELRDL